MTPKGEFLHGSRNSQFSPQYLTAAAQPPPTVLLLREQGCRRTSRFPEGLPVRLADLCYIFFYCKGHVFKGGIKDHTTWSPCDTCTGCHGDGGVVSTTSLLPRQPAVQHALARPLFQVHKQTSHFPDWFCWGMIDFVSKYRLGGGGGVGEGCQFRLRGGIFLYLLCEP